MAVRDDFTAGEVLAAADLNDTFASKPPFAYGTATPSTTVEGFIWYDENESPPAAKFWDGAAFQLVSPSSGLVHIATQSFSAVSSVSVNDCFTSTYANYVIYFKGTANTGSPSLYARWRVAGTDNTTANSYTRQEIFANAGTLSGSRASADFTFFGEISTTESNLIINVFSPQLTTVTSHRSVTVSGRSAAGIFDVSGTHNQSVAYDGFTAYPPSGTMTGNLRVYGVKN